VGTNERYASGWIPERSTILLKEIAMSEQKFNGEPWERVLFYFDKDSFEKAYSKIKETLEEISKDRIDEFYILSSSEDDMPTPYGLKSRKDGKSCLSYSAPEDVHSAIRAIGWNSFGVTGFEEIKTTKVVEIDVVMTPIGILHGQ